MEKPFHPMLVPSPYGDASPATVYADAGNRNAAYYRIFFSAPITSAGARRLLKTSTPDHAQIEAVARMNWEIATSLIDACLPSLPVDSLISSSLLLGRWNGWNQSAHLRSRLYHIAGIPSEEARRFDRLYHTRVDSGRHDIAREPFTLLALFCEFLEQVADLHPVRRLICLPDAPFSRGCQNEIRLARYLAIPIETIELDLTHADFPQLECLSLLAQIAQADSGYVLPFVDGDGAQLVRFVALDGRGLRDHDSVSAGIR
jgi:hypothetical protein